MIHGTCVPQHAHNHFTKNLFTIIEEEHSKESHDLLDFT